MHLAYQSKCDVFNISKLDMKRTRGDLLQMYKLSNKLDTILRLTNPIVRELRGGLFVREVVKHCNIGFNVFYKK